MLVKLTQCVRLYVCAIVLGSSLNLPKTVFIETYNISSILYIIIIALCIALLGGLLCNWIMRIVLLLLIQKKNWVAHHFTALVYSLYYVTIPLRRLYSLSAILNLRYAYPKGYTETGLGVRSIINYMMFFRLWFYILVME